MNIHDKQIERTAYVRLVTRLDYLVHELECLGDSEMGLIHHSQATIFHRATELLRMLQHDLKQDAMWPREASQ